MIGDVNVDCHPFSSPDIDQTYSDSSYGHPSAFDVYNHHTGLHTPGVVPDTWPTLTNTPDEVGHVFVTPTPHDTNPPMGWGLTAQVNHPTYPWFNMGDLGSIPISDSDAFVNVDSPGYEDLNGNSFLASNVSVDRQHPVIQGNIFEPNGPNLLTPTVVPAAPAVPIVLLPTRPMRQAKLSIPCNLCGRTFSRQADLTRHIKSVHNMIKDHVCPFIGCGKAYSRKDKLANHKKSKNHY